MSVTFSAANMTPDNIALQPVQDNILLSHLVYKCLVKITVWLWNKMGRLPPQEHQQHQAWVCMHTNMTLYPNKPHVQVEDIFKSSMDQVKALADLRKNIVSSVIQNDSMKSDQIRRTVVLLTKHLRTFGKFFRRLQQLSPERFVLLPMCGDLIMSYWSQIVDSTNYPQNLICGGLL